MKSRLIVLVLSIISVNIFAQHDLQSSLYPDNKFLINPANAGDKNNSPFCLLGYRYSFSGISGSLRRPMLAFHSPISNEVGLGGLLSFEQMGIFEYYTLSGSYSYTFNIAKNKKLRFGLSSGIYSRSIDRAKIKVEQEKDNLLQDDYFSSVFFFGGAGVQLELNDLCINASLPKLYSAENKSFVDAAIGGVEYKLPLYDNSLTPSVYVNYLKGNPVRADFNLLFRAPEKYLIMASFRSDKSGCAGGGLNINNLNISYIFELNMDLVSASKGTHEIILSYTFEEFKFRKNRR